jgi:hypothetical protein
MIGADHTCIKLWFWKVKNLWRGVIFRPIPDLDKGMTGVIICTMPGRSNPIISDTARVLPLGFGGLTDTVLSGANDDDHTTQNH